MHKYVSHDVVSYLTKNRISKYSHSHLKCSNLKYVFTVTYIKSSMYVHGPVYNIHNLIIKIREILILENLLPVIH